MSKINKGRTISAGVVMLALVIAAASFLYLRSRLPFSFASPTDVEITVDTTWNGDHSISGTLTVKAGKTLTIDSSAGTQITVNAYNLIVEATAKITADAKGSAGGAATADGAGTGAGKAGGTGKGAGGAGYGGTGADGYNNSGSGGASYGTPSNPTANGSGGGGGATDAGGAGGGAMRLLIGNLTTLDGTISANGADGANDTDGSGAGSGGSIYLKTPVLSGSGSITATGGNGTATGGTGAGGRVAIIYTDKSNFSGTITANGGASGYGSAGNGSVYQSATAQVALFSGGSGSGYAKATVFYFPSSSPYIWTGLGSDNSALTAANWAQGSAPTSGVSVYFGDVSTKNCTWDITDSIADFTVDYGYGPGTITLNNNFTSTSTILINGGTLVDNAKTVNFKNASIANASGLLTSTGTWVETDSGTCANPNESTNSLAILKITSGKTCTLTGNFNAKKLILEDSSTITGGYTFCIYSPIADGPLVQGTSAVISTGSLILKYCPNITQGPLNTTSDTTVYGVPNTLTMSGNWNVGNLSVYGLIGSTTPQTLDTNGYNLTVNGYLRLGKSNVTYPGAYTGKILFRNGTHTIGGKIYCDGQYTHGYIDLGSSTVNLAGDLALNYCSLTPGAGTLNITGTGTSVLYAVLDYAYKDATLDNPVLNKIPLYNLTSTASGKTIQVETGKTLTIANNMTLQGASGSGNLLNFQSTSAGNAANLNVSGTAINMQYLNVKDSNASSGKGVLAYNSTDSGNNTNWFFGSSGNVYWTNASADGKWSTASNWSTGVAPQATDSVYFNSISTTNCSVDTTASVANLTIDTGYTGTVTLGATLSTTAAFTLTQGGFDAASYNVSVGTNFTCSGLLTRSLSLGSGTWTVAGNWDSSGNNITITPGTSTVSLTGTGTLKTNPTTSFYNLSLAASTKTTTIARDPTKNLWVAVDSGTNTLAYSSDGISWTGLGKSIFTEYGCGIAYNGTRWVAVGSGTTNTLAYSSDGITWTGLGKSIFTSYGYGIAWNGTRFVAAGQGGNSLAYSSDGLTWTGLGTSIFTDYGYGIAWNGTRWVAAGYGTNALAYSSDGITWTGLGTSIFSSGCNGIAWNGTRFVAGGYSGGGGNTLAYSSDGITWTGLGSSIFSTSGRAIAWNGTRFVAAGWGTNSIAYSSDGINWTAATNMFSQGGFAIAWNGTRFVAVGNGTNCIAYSSDGITWTGITGTSIFDGGSIGKIASCPAPKLTPPVLSDDIVVLNTLTLGGGTLSRNGTDLVALTLRNTASSSLALNSTTINSGVSIRFAPDTASATVSIPGGNYSSASIDAYATKSSIAYQLADHITGSLALNVYADSGLSTTFTLNNKNFTSSNITLGKDSSAIGSVTFNSGSGTVTLAALTGLIPTTNSGSHTLNLNTSTWNVAGDWDSSGTQLTLNPSTSTVNLTGTGTLKTSPANSFYNLSLAASTKTTTIARDPTKNIWVAVGCGTNTLAYSSDGLTWTGLGTSIFSSSGYDVAWNGTRFVAAGAGTNTLAYSSDGINWTGLGPIVFSNNGSAIAWNGTRWVAGGYSGNSLAYSSDGITWTGLGNSIFSDSCSGIAWNGTRFVAVGYGTANTIAYSSDGINWTGVSGSTSIFSSGGRRVAWNGTRFVAVGIGTNTLAYSSDGINWIVVPNSTSIISTNGFGIAWNGTRFVAIGQGSTNTLAYSSDGIKWTGLGTSIFGGWGIGIAWNGTRFVAGGNATSSNNTIAYSSDGTSWTGLGKSIFSEYSYGIASCPAPELTPPVLNDDIIVLNTLTLGGGTLSRNGTDLVALTLRNTASSSLALNSTTINSGVSIKFAPDTASATVSIPGGNYSSATIDAYATKSSIAYQLADHITGSAALNVYADSGLSTTFTLNNKNFTSSGLSFGKDCANGSVTLSSGTGTVTLSSFSPISSSNVGTHTLNLNTSTWNVAGDWDTSGNNLTLNPSTSTVNLTGTGTLKTSPANSFYNLSCAASTKTTTIARDPMKNIWVGGTSGAGSTKFLHMAYSLDNGATWTGITGINIFTHWAGAIAYNGTRWVATGGGYGNNTTAYSSDGINWTAGTNIFGTGGNSVAWNGTRWVAAGSGGNSLAYSSDGITWTGLGTSIFSTGGNGIAWNGTRFVAVGQGTNSIAYSSDGITWTGLGKSIFTSYGYGIAWNGTRWVASGVGTNTLAYSLDGINWTGLGTSIFSGGGRGIAWNGTRFVAVGYGTNTIAYSSDGITWTAVPNSTSIFANYADYIAWNGTRFVATGYANNIIAYSSDGINWTGLGNAGVFGGDGQGIASCPAPELTPPVLSDEIVVLNTLTLGGGTLNRNSTDLVALTLRNTASSSLSLNSTTINSGVTIKFMPNTASTTSIPGGNYSSASIDAYATTNNITFQLADSITQVSSLNIYADSSTATTFSLNSKNLTLTNLYFGKDSANGAVTFNSSSGTITMPAFSGVVPDNAGSHTLNLNTSTWNLHGDWKPDGAGNSTLSISPGTSTVNLTDNTNFYGLKSGADINTIPLYSLSSTAAGKSINCEAGKTLKISGILSLQGTSGNTIFLRSLTDGNAWKLNLQGGASGLNYLDVKDSDASSGKGVLAYNSTNSGNNINWFFGAAGNVYWTNGSGDGKWSTAANWSTGVVPQATDSVYFNSITIANCSVDTAASVANLALDTGYSGTVTLGATLSTTAAFTLTQGGFDAASYNVSVGTNFTSSGALTRSLSLGSGAWTVAGNWDSSGNNITITPGTSTVNLTGTGTLKTSPLNSFYNLSCAASTKTTTIARDPTKNIWVAGGYGANTLAYSLDNGATWTGLGISIFSSECDGIAWNGTRFVAVGYGTNSIAYSSDGINWTGLGTSIFSQGGNGIAWNGTRFVAGGYGTTNTLAYSSDGLTWTGLGTSIFSGAGQGIVWNGTRFVATGGGTNSLAYSSDGINWTAVSGSTSIFSVCGRGIAWNGTRFVAGGQGTDNTLAYSSDGITWTAVSNSTSIFSNYGCFGFAWNGTRWVAVGDGTISGTNSIAYSSDGITWTGATNSTSIFSSAGRGIAWNGTRFVAGGGGTTNALAYSSDGISWTGLGKSIFGSSGWGGSIGSCPAPKLTPPVLSDDIIVLNTLTLAGGTLSRNSTDLVAFTLRSTSSGSLVLNSSTINSGVSIKFAPDTASATVSIPGGNYGSATIDAYATKSSIAYQLADHITGSSSLNVYADSGLSTTFTLNNKNFTSSGLSFGKDAAIGSVTFNSGSGTVTLPALTSLIPDNAGSHTLNLNTSTWNLTGDINPEGAGSAALTLNPGASTVNLNIASVSILYGLKSNSTLPLYNLTSTSAGKTLKVYAGNTLSIAGNFTLQGANANLLSFQSTSAGNAASLNVQGAATNMQYLSVKDSNASSGKSVIAYNSTNVSNNTNWIFGASGDVYWTNGSGDGKWSTAANWSTGVVPQTTDSVYFSTASTSSCSVDTNPTIVNLTLGTGYTGTVTLSATSGQDLTVTNSITINTNGGTLVDNGRTVNFKNASIANENNRLTSTGNWKQTASGNIANPSYSTNKFNSLELASSVTGTLTDSTGTKRLIQGDNSTVTGNFLSISSPTIDNFITQGTGATISSLMEIRIPAGTSRSQGALTTSGNLMINSSGSYTLTMTGDWNIGGYLKVYSDSASGATGTLDTNAKNLTVGSYLLLGNSNASYPNGYLGKILFSSGTHTIGGNIYVDGQYTHGYIDFGSGTVNTAGGADFTYSDLTWTGSAKLNVTGNNASVTFPGDLSLASGQELNFAADKTGQVLNIGGNFTVDSGATFTPGACTTKFTATSGTKVIDMVYNPNTPSINKFYNVTFDGVGGTWQYQPTSSQQPLQVANDFSLVNGTFDDAATGTNKNITIGHDLISSGSNTRSLKFGASTAWSIAGSATLTGSNLSAELGSATITVGANWDSSGSNSITAGTSTVNLTGTGTLKTNPSNTFYNLSLAASTKTTTIARDPTKNIWVAGGKGSTNNTLAYSSDGITWTGLGSSIFSDSGSGIAWNGTRWVAGGKGSTNTLAYSSDGLTWTGLGKSIFSSNGSGIAWNGTRFVAVGSSTNTIAYSSDGITWTGLGSSIFSGFGSGVCWNGSKFVAVGQGTNSIAYSSDGLTWTGLGNIIFSTAGYSIAWNGTRWVAGGEGTNSIAYSSDGITWTGLGTSIFSNYGQGIAWNGTRFVAVGLGSANSIAYSTDGITWTGLGKSIFSSTGRGIAWNGTRFVATGVGTNSIAYSSDGLSWTPVSGSTSIFSTTEGLGVASCPAPKLIPPILSDDIQVLNILTLGGGTLTRNSTDQVSLTLRNTLANTPLVLNNSTITNNAIIRFAPLTAKTVSIPGGNYGAGVIDASADFNGVTFQVAGNISAASGLNAYAKNTTTSGTVTQASARLSLVNGTAFADFCAENSLAPYIGKHLVIKDSAGKLLKGWIKAAGTGETYGSELVTNGSFTNWTGNVPTGWTQNFSPDANNYTEQAPTGQLHFVTNTSYDKNIHQAPLTLGWLVKSSMDIIAVSGGDGVHPVDFGVCVDRFYSTTGTKSQYTTSGSIYVSLYINNANVTLDNCSAKQVLTPSTTGVTIVSAQNGTTYNWESEDNGFNRNDSNGYSYDILEPNATTGSVTQANTKLSFANGVAFADFSTADILTSNIGKYLVIKDSSGKKLEGYIKAAGAGETYSAEKLTGWTNNSLDTLVVSGTDITSCIDTAGGFAAAVTNNLGLSAGSLIKSTFNITKVSDSYPSFREFTLSSGTLATTGTIENGLSSDGVKTYYGTQPGTDSYCAFKKDDIAVNFSIASPSIIQVLTPSTNGVTIVSTADGTIYNWTTQDSGFNPNDTNGYTYGIYDTPPATTTVDFNNKNLGLGYIKLGKDTNTGSVMLSAGNGSVTFSTTAGLSVNNNAGTHTLNMGGSTWTVLGNWNLTQGSGAITMNSQTSTLILSGVADALVYGDNNFYNLKCITAGKHLYFEDAKTQAVANNLIFAGASGNYLLLNSISQTPSWLFNVQGQATVVYVNVYNSDARSGKTIMAAGSNDGGNNFNWNFTPIGTVYWTGTGNDNNWSNPDNWSIVAVPGTSDSVVFDSTAVKDCNVDVAASVKSLSLDTGYTGKLTLAAALSTTDNLVINQGSLDAVTYDVSVGKDFSSTGTATRAITMGSGSWSVGGNWNTSGSNITLTPGSASLTMSGNTFTMSAADITFNALTFSGTTSATLTCGGSFNPGSFTSTSIKPSIEFTATASGKTFNPGGVSFTNVTFSGAAGEWTLADNLTAAGTVTVSAGKLIDNAKTINFKSLSVVNAANRLVSTGTWNQNDTGTVTNAANKFKQLNVAASGKTTTLGSDISADVLSFGIGTFKGESKTITLTAATNPILTNSSTAFTASTKLAALKVNGVQSQGVMHLGSNLVTDAVEFYRPTGAIAATGNWDLGNNTFRFYADAAATGKVALTDGANNYNLTAGSIQLGSKTAADAPAYLNLGSGTHSIGSFVQAYSGTVTATLSIEMAAATISNYSGNLDLTPFTWTCGTSTLSFANSTGVKSITTADKPLYSVIFNDTDTEWQLQDDLTLKGSITYSNGTFTANGKKLILIGQDIATIDGNFTAANNSALYDLSCAVAGKQIKFAAGKTITVTHEFDITGSSASRIKLNSTNTGSQWSIDAQTANVLLAEVRDSNAIKQITATRSIDVASSNTNWQFSPIRAWDGGGGDNKWSTAANWEDNTIPTADESVIFDATSSKDCVVDSAVTVKDFLIDSGYSGTVSIGEAGSITSTETITLLSGTLNDSGRPVNFHNLEIADASGLLVSSGTWVQETSGTINSPNSDNKIDYLAIAGADITTTLESDLYVNSIEFGIGEFYGGEKTLHIYGNTDFITTDSEQFIVGTTLGTLAAIKVHDCLSQGAFQLPDDFVSGTIDWWFRTSGASATGAWDFGNNDVRFYTDSGASGSLKMGAYSLSAGDVQLGSDAAANKNANLDLGSGTHTIKSFAKAYAGTVTGTLKLQMGSGTLNCTSDINLTSIDVTPGTSTLNLSGTLAQAITTAGNSFSTVNFSGSGAFNISGDFTAASAVVTEAKAINCSGSFIITQSLTPATSTVTLNSTSSGRQVSIPLNNSFYNLILNGTGGEWTLTSPLAVSNTLTITNGKLIDNAKAVSFKNVSIADKANILASTATWTQSASGEVRCPNKDSRINTLSICANNMVTTFTGNVAVNKVTFGTGTLVGAAKSLYAYGTSNSIDCAAAFVVNSSLSAIYTENHTSQNALKLPNNLVTDSIYWRADAGTLAATGAWDFGNNSVTFYTTPATNKEIQLSSLSLTCGTLRLGAPDNATYPATLNLGSGTHTIGTITKAYSGTTSAVLNLLGGSSKFNSSGSIDFTGITFTPSTSAVTMQGGSGQKTILSASQQFYDLTFDDADTSWALQDTLTVQRNLILTAGSFVHNNKKVVLASLNNTNISGGFTFYDLECTTSGKRLYFSANLVQTVQGTFTITGAEGDNIKLYSQSSPQTWYIDANHAAVSYVNVKDSVAQKTIVPVNSIDEGNNTGWIIGGKFTFETPAANSLLTVGSTTNLRWSTDSGIVQARLYYSTNASQAEPTWKPITVDPIAVNPNGQKTSYDWVIPDDISSDCKVRIVAVVNGEESSNLYAVSEPVKIMGVLTLTYPTAEGTGWPVTVSKNITWTTTGTISSVKVYCSTQGADGTWDYIGETGTNTYYSWNPSDKYGADFRSDTCYIKITDSRYESLAYGISSHNFMLSSGGLENAIITTAQGQTKTTLISGLSYQIRWDTGGSVPTVNIAYSVDAGAWQDIALGISNDNRFDGITDSGPWVITHELSNNVVVRVSDASKPEILVKTATLNIVAPFTITAPTDGSIWLGGSNYSITWQNASGSVINNVKIEYTTDGAAWSEINNGTYTKTNDLNESWSVPEVSANSAQVRVSNLADSTGFAYAVSAGTFKIKRGNVTMLSPNTQVTWKVGEVHIVEWAKSGDVAQVKLYYCPDANSPTPTWKNVVPSGAALDASVLQYAWTIPNDISDTCLVKVVDASDSQISDTSDTTFLIKPNIILNVPNGGQTWVTGKVYNIVWSTSGTVPKVKLYYSTNNGTGWSLITANAIDNSGNYPWVIPEGNVSSDCLVRVQSSTDETAYGQSAAKFAITLASITVSAPKSGDIWVKGDQNMEIKWVGDGTIYPNLTIAYSANGNFSDAVTLVANQQNTGSYLWTITDNITVSATAKIRVKDMDWAGRGFTVQGISEQFEITAPRIDVTSPKTNDRIIIGTDFQIKWAARGKDISTVKILYSPTADFVNDVYTVAEGLTASSGTYTYNWKDAGGNWKTTIPLSTAVAAKVRVIDESNQTIYKDSGAFRVVGTFVITAPAAQARLFVSKTASINWSTIGNVANAKLSYSANGNGSDAVWFNMDGGDNVTAPTVVTNPGIGTYTWTVLDLTPSTHAPNSNVYIKIEDPSDPLVYDLRQFTVTYYAIKWKVVDQAGLVGDLSALIVKSTDLASDTQFEMTSGLKSGDTLYYYPNKKYTSVWSRDAYLATAVTEWEAYDDGWARLSDGTIINTLDPSSSNYSLWKVKMPQQLVTKVLNVQGSYYYDANSDTLSVNGWLMQQDTMIASGSDGVTEGFIEIFEESTNNSLIDSTQAISSVLNQNGIFNVKWSGLRANGKLIQGKNYFARLRLQYQGGPYMWGVVPFQITGALDIQAIQQSLGVTTGQTIVGEVQKVLGVTGGVGEETIAQKISEVKGQAINILTAAETTIPAKITEARQQLVTAVEQEVKPHVQSGILNRDTTVKQGDAVEISYRTTTGLSPTVTVYDPKNRIRVNSKPLLEIGTTGVYTYKVTFLAAWGTGDFTVVCTEATQGTADALVMTVTQTNIEEVSGQVAAVLGSTTGIGGLRDVADTLNTQFNAIDSALTKLSTQIIGKVQETKGAISNLESVFTQLEAMSKQIRSIGGTTGINLEKLYNVSKDKKGDITYLKNKAQELKAAMEISQKLIENAAKKPVVQTWFEFK
jgi:hypothetical protein